MLCCVVPGLPLRPVIVEAAFSILIWCTASWMTASTYLSRMLSFGELIVLLHPTQDDTKMTTAVMALWPGLMIF
jgi:hypothetical protein